MSMDVGIPKTAIKVIDFGPLPDATAKSVAHGLTQKQFENVVNHWCQIFNSASNNKFMLPYLSTVATGNITYALSDTSVTITTGSNRSSLTAKVYIEYEID